MKFETRQSVNDGLEYLATRLEPIISQKMRDLVGEIPWTAVLHELDRLKDKHERPYNPVDLHVQLRMFTEKLGNLGFPFDNPFTREVSTYGQELRVARNQWAHGATFELAQTLRIHDSIVRLLTVLGDDDGAKHAGQFYFEVLQILAGQHETRPELNHGFAEFTEESDDTEDEYVKPDESVFQRLQEQQQEQSSDCVSEQAQPAVQSDSLGALIGNRRQEFQAWEPTQEGHPAETDSFRRKAHKGKLLAIAQVAIESEGPIHLDRLTSRVAAAYNIRRLRDDRRRRIRRAIKTAKMDWQIDEHEFVWPQDLNPQTWSEFRPNDSNAGRSFHHISPIEIVNAAKFIRAREPELDDGELERLVLQVFGRKRKTKPVSDHLKVVSQLPPKRQPSLASSGKAVHN